MCWDRGRLARNEREARKSVKKVPSEILRACGAFAGGTPAVPAPHLSGFTGAGDLSYPCLKQSANAHLHPYAMSA